MKADWSRRWTLSFRINSPKTRRERITGWFLRRILSQLDRGRWYFAISIESDPAVPRDVQKQAIDIGLKSMKHVMREYLRHAAIDKVVEELPEDHWR